MGEAETLTLTRARIPITDSNTAFTEAISTTSLAALRALISAFNAAHVAERAPTSGRVSPTAQDSKPVMIQSGGRWGMKKRRWGANNRAQDSHDPNITDAITANSLREAPTGTEDNPVRTTFEPWCN